MILRNSKTNSPITHRAPFHYTYNAHSFPKLVMHLILIIHCTPFLPASISAREATTFQHYSTSFVFPPFTVSAYPRFFISAIHHIRASVHPHFHRYDLSGFRSFAHPLLRPSTLLLIPTSAHPSKFTPPRICQLTHLLLHPSTLPSIPTSVHPRNDPFAHLPLGASAN